MADRFDTPAVAAAPSKATVSGGTARLLATTAMALGMSLMATLAFSADPNAGGASRTGVSVAKAQSCTPEILRDSDTYCYSYTTGKGVNTQTESYCYYGPNDDYCVTTPAELENYDRLGERPVYSAPSPPPVALSETPSVNNQGSSTRSLSLDTLVILDDPYANTAVGAFMQGYDTRYEAIRASFRPGEPGSCRPYLRKLYRRASVGVRASDPIAEDADGTPQLSGPSDGQLPPRCSRWRSPASERRGRYCEPSDKNEEFSVACVNASVRDIAVATFELQSVPSYEIYDQFPSLLYTAKNFRNLEEFGREMSCLVDSMNLIFSFACSEYSEKLRAAGARLQSTGIVASSYIEQNVCEEVVRDICNQVNPILQEAQEELELISSQMR